MVGDLTVTFDLPLEPGVTASANWIYRSLEVLANAGPNGVAVGADVEILRSGGIGDTNPPRCSYAAAPADVIGLNGTPVAAFTDFPVTIV